LRTSITHTKGTADTARSFGSVDRTFSSHISFTLLVRMIFRSSWTTTASSDYIGAPRITTGAAARELAPSRPVSKFTGSTTYSESFPAHEATARYVQPQSEAYASGMPFEGTTTMEADFQGLPRITTGGAAREVRHTQRACLQFRLRSRTPLSSLSFPPLSFVQAARTAATKGAVRGRVGVQHCVYKQVARAPKIVADGRAARRECV